MVTSLLLLWCFICGIGDGSFVAGVDVVAVVVVVGGGVLSGVC